MQQIILVILFVLLIVYSLLLIYCRNAWNSIPGFFHHTSVVPSTPITVIIPARNEEATINDCLQSITRQSYPAALFEIIVIDDHSTDRTAEIVKNYNASNLKLISLQDHVAADGINSYKKKAIEIGISQCTGKLIVTTDADCLVQKGWLSTIAHYYEQHTPAFIAAPVSINCNVNALEIFQAVDFMTLQGITGAAVSKNLLTMCNGANLAYERDAFYAVDGFSGIENIASGDDMLLMHKIYKQYPDRIHFLKSKDVTVQTAPQKSVTDFLKQRIRWASKSGKYDDKRILPVLMMVYFLNLLFLIFPVFNFMGKGDVLFLNLSVSSLNVWLTLLLWKILIELYFLFPVAEFFNKRSLLWAFPLLQPFHILYTVIAGFMGMFGKYEWKGRTVR